MTDAGHDGWKKGKEKMMSMFIDKQEILEEEHYFIKRIVQDFEAEPEKAFLMIAGANIFTNGLLGTMLEKEEERELMRACSDGDVQ